MRSSIVRGGTLQGDYRGAAYNGPMRLACFPLATALAASLTLASCFEPPVREALRLHFRADGSVVVTSTVVVTSPQDGSNPALQKRLAETRQALLDGQDPWGARFAAVEPAAERFGWEKRLGELHQASRDALLTEPGDLGRFFSDTSLTVTYEVRSEEGRAELTISPGAAARATRAQRKQMERTLGEWTAQVADYLEAAEDLYTYVDDHPDRARPCFGTLFSDLLPDEDRKGLGELTPEELRIVERLAETMRQVWDVLLVPEGSGHSPDEISHLVYDPFPARLTVRLPGQPLEVEGFAKGDENTLTVVGPGLWEALLSLEGRWLAPDPVLLYVRQGGQSQDQTLDLDAFLSEPRRAEPAPSSVEVRREIEARLVPAPFYRVAWRIDPGDEAPFKWEEE